MTSVRKIDVELLKTMPLPDWNEDASKASRGKLLVIGGSRHLPGAAVLAARAALRIGCGNCSSSRAGKYCVRNRYCRSRVDGNSSR